MNIITLTPDKLVLVTGGLIHAIRYDSFLAEWSMSPGQDDIKKGNLKDATVAPYDRTDGKTPRPGKEDLAGSLEVMTDADTFGQSDPDQLLAKPITLAEDADKTHLALFRTPTVFVDQYQLHGSCSLSLRDRGKPLFIRQGQIEISHQGRVVAQLNQGDECVLPYDLEEVELTSTSPTETIINTWHTPFKSELEVK
jgi:hypothetical protein